VRVNIAAARKIIANRRCSVATTGGAPQRALIAPRPL
jgi:hypothetical protein